MRSPHCCWRAPRLPRLSTPSNMASGPFASIRIVGRFRYRASMTTAGGEQNARAMIGTATAPTSRLPSKRNRSADPRRLRPGRTGSRIRKHFTRAFERDGERCASGHASADPASGQYASAPSSAGRRPRRQARAAAGGCDDSRSSSAGINAPCSCGNGPEVGQFTARCMADGRERRQGPD